MNTLCEQYKTEIIDTILSKRVEDGSIQTAIPFLSFFTICETTEMIPVVYEPSLCLVVQGTKEILLGEETFQYNSSSYLLASIHMPARVRIFEASKERPYVSLKLTFTMEDIFEVLKDVRFNRIEQESSFDKGLCFAELNTQILDPIARLIRLLETPENIKFMAPLIIKEILYLIINDKGGAFLRHYVLDGSIVQQVSKAINTIKQNFSETINMKDLAKSFGMSESSLYHNFKKITMMSPLQFQKTLRLQEARHMLLSQNIDASEVAFTVGYESPSQFSREYARMFGLPPKTHVKATKDEPENVA